MGKGKKPPGGGSGTGKLSAGQQAWAIGCSEAQYALQQVPTPDTVTMWWLDEETANSWSSSNLSLNLDAIDGAVSYAQTYGGVPTGVPNCCCCDAL